MVNFDFPFIAFTFLSLLAIIYSEADVSLLDSKENTIWN